MYAILRKSIKTTEKKSLEIRKSKKEIVTSRSSFIIIIFLIAKGY